MPRPARTRLLSILLGVLLATAPAALAGGAASAAEAPDWTVRTAANDQGTDRSDFSYDVEPGDTIQDGIVVTNRGDAPLELTLLTGAAHTTAAGRLDVAGSGGATGVGAWVRLARTSLTLQPGAAETVPLTIAVPKGARAGDHVGAVVTAAESGTDVVRRLGIRTIVRVLGDLAPAVRLEGARVAWSGGASALASGTASLTYTIHNTGNTVVALQQAASVAGPFGWSRRSGGGEALPRLLPGERWTATVPVPGVPGLGRLDGTASVTPIVTDAAGTTSELDPVVVRAQGWAVPWLPLLLVAAVLALAVIALRLRRRRVPSAAPAAALPEASR